MERRYFEVEEMRVEPSGEGEPEVIRGKIPYDSKSLDMGGFFEEIMPGAFARAMREMDQVALWSHDPSRPLGRRSRGTLRLEETKTGLMVEILPPNTTWGRDAVESVRRGDVSNMSFGFTVPKGGDNWREWRGQVIRSLIDVDLREVSPVAFGAYPSSQAQARDLFGEVPEVPEALRDPSPVLPANGEGVGMPADVPGARALAENGRDGARARRSQLIGLID